MSLTLRHQLTALDRALAHLLDERARLSREMVRGAPLPAPLKTRMPLERVLVLGLLRCKLCPFWRVVISQCLRPSPPPRLGCMLNCARCCTGEHLGPKSIPIRSIIDPGGPEGEGADAPNKGRMRKAAFEARGGRGGYPKSIPNHSPIYEKKRSQIDQKVIKIDRKWRRIRKIPQKCRV